MSMQSIPVKTIKNLLQAELLQGSESWSIEHAIYYNRHDLERRNTLIFISRNDSVNWQEIDDVGPSLVISDKSPTELANALSNTTVLRVTSTIQAYWTFIRYYRGLFKIPVVALTGTCGKTTTKEMIKHILSEDWHVQASISSKNEPRQSLPYLMGIDKNTEAAVFELGLGNSGNIKHQCMIYQPTIGIITNIGVHHLDGCENLEGYIKAKSEILDGLPKNGTLIINADDENTKKINFASFTGEIITIGINESATYNASRIQFIKHGMRFVLHVGRFKYTVYVPGYGEHQVYNALAAIAAIDKMGMPIKHAIARLRTFTQMERHLEFSNGINDCTVIDDTWTNNPTSVKAALNVLDNISKGKKVIVILGDIKRLGDFEEKYHREIGTMVAQREIHTLITIGNKAENIAKQALKDGTKANVHMFQDVTEILEILQSDLDRDTIVLIKGPMSSRAMIDFAKRLKES